LKVKHGIGLLLAVLLATISCFAQACGTSEYGTVNTTPVTSGWVATKAAVVNGVAQVWINTPNSNVVPIVGEYVRTDFANSSLAVLNIASIVLTSSVSGGSGVQIIQFSLGTSNANINIGTYANPLSADTGSTVSDTNQPVSQDKVFTNVGGIAATIYLPESDGSSPYPYTVNETISIEGSNQPEINGDHVITAVGPGWIQFTANLTTDFSLQSDPLAIVGSPFPVNFLYTLEGQAMGNLDCVTPPFKNKITPTLGGVVQPAKSSTTYTPGTYKSYTYSNLDYQFLNDTYLEGNNADNCVDEPSENDSCYIEIVLPLQNIEFATTYMALISASTEDACENTAACVPCAPYPYLDCSQAGAGTLIASQWADEDWCSNAPDYNPESEFQYYTWGWYAPSWGVNMTVTPNTTKPFPWWGVVYSWSTLCFLDDDGSWLCQPPAGLHYQPSVYSTALPEFHHCTEDGIN
jgi:hypothetical protein